MFPQYLNLLQSYYNGISPIWNASHSLGSIGILFSGFKFIFKFQISIYNLIGNLVPNSIGYIFICDKFRKKYI